MDKDRYPRRPGASGGKDGGGLDIEVVVVVAGDGEVPHPAVVDGRDRTSDYDGCLAVRRLEMHARFEVFCRNPAVVRIRCVDWTNGTLVMNLRTP
jgi:hypothetical protein